VDTLAYNPAQFLPPVRWGSACPGEVNGRVFLFGGAVLSVDAIDDEKCTTDVGHPGYRLTNRVYAYSTDLGVWYNVQPRNGQPDPELPVLMDSTQLAAQVADRAANPVDDAKPAAGGMRRASLGQRRPSVLSASFMEALSIHVPTPRTAVASTCSWGKVVVMTTAPAAIQANLQSRIDKESEHWRETHGPEVTPPSLNLLAISGSVYEAPTSGLFWVHGGQGGRKGDARPSPGAELEGDDLRVEQTAATIGNTHGFQMYGQAALSSLLSLTAPPDEGTSPEPTSERDNQRESLKGGTTNPDLAASASVRMLGRMLRGGGGQATVTYECFDDFYAFDTQSHTWRKIDTTGNVLAQTAQRSASSPGSPKGGHGLADAFARPRPRRGHSIASFVVAMPSGETTASANAQGQQVAVKSWKLVPKLVIFGGSGFYQSRGDVCFSDLWLVDDCGPGKETYRCIHGDGQLVTSQVAVANGGSRYGYGVGSLNDAVYTCEYAYEEGDGLLSSPLLTRPVPPPRAQHSCVVVANGMYMYGGTSDSGLLNDLWRLDLLRMTWCKVGPFLPSPPLASSFFSSTVTSSAPISWPPELFGASMFADPDPAFATSR
jgi:hypothetical protein